MGAFILPFTQRMTAIKVVALGGLSLLLIAVLLYSLSIGAVSISTSEIIRIFLSKIGLGQTSASEVEIFVLVGIRLPRILFTVLIGASLGIAGASLQGLFRNPLVEPGILGISSGAALGAIIIIMGGKLVKMPLIISEGLGQWLLPVFSIIGALAATFFTLRVGRYEGRTIITILILAGVAVTSLVGAVIGLSVFYADDTQLRTFSFWTLGDLSGASWQKLLVLTPVVLVPAGILSTYGRALNAMALGEAEAFHSGINVERVKLLIIIFCSVAVGTSVSFAGIIGFIGLVVPHIIRISFSPEHTLLLPASALGGACLLLFADMIARTAVSPAELPIGIVTAMMGTPFFLYLLMVNKRKRMF